MKGGGVRRGKGLEIPRQNKVEERGARAPGVGYLAASVGSEGSVFFLKKKIRVRENEAGFIGQE